MVNFKTLGLIIIGIIIISLLWYAYTPHQKPQPNFEITELKCTNASGLGSSYYHTAFEGVIKNNGNISIDSLTLRLSLYNKDNARVSVGDSFPTVQNLRPNEKIRFSGSIMSYDNSEDCLNGKAYVVARYYPGWEHGSTFASTKPTHGNIEVYNTHCDIGHYGPQLRTYVKNLDSVKHKTILLYYYIYDENMIRIEERRADVDNILPGEIVVAISEINNNLYNRCLNENLTFEIHTFQYD